MKNEKNPIYRKNVTNPIKSKILCQGNTKNNFKNAYLRQTQQNTQILEPKKKTISNLDFDLSL